MCKKLKTNYKYDKIKQADIFALMNSPDLSDKERDVLYDAFKEKNELFTTVRFGKTLVVNQVVAKNYINSDFHRFSSIKKFSACLALFTLLFFTISTSQIDYNPVSLVLAFLHLSIFAANLLIAFHYHSKECLLELSEEHIDRAINPRSPNYNHVDIEVPDSDPTQKQPA